MRLLAIETSTALGGVAVIDSERGLMVESRLNVRVEHSERLMPEIDSCLNKSGLRLRDIDAFAASSGPGSFTGLRIGLSTLKGLAYATGKPVVAVPTLESMAWAFPGSAYPVCPLLDARKKEVYAAVFVWRGGGFERLMPEASMGMGHLLPLLYSMVGAHEKVIFIGEGADIYKAEIESAFAGRPIFAPPHLNVPMPSATAYIGLMKALKGEFEDPAALVPFYIRKSEAELKLGGTRPPAK